MKSGGYLVVAYSLRTASILCMACPIFKTTSLVSNVLKRISLRDNPGSQKPIKKLNRQISGKRSARYCFLTLNILLMRIFNVSNIDLLNERMTKIFLFDLEKS